MKNKILHTAFAVIASLLFITVHAQDSVIIIRHGEKPDDGDNLSCKGLNRSLGIPGSLSSKFSIPLYTYIPTIDCGKDTKHSRMFQTVTPFAVQYDLTINSKHEVDDINGVANAVIGKLGTKSKHGTILLVWEHKNIQPIAVALGVKDAPKWQGSDFDSIWVITNAGTSNAKLKKGAEGLNGVSNTCP